ncbi:MAG: asparaginase [Roseburia sp.]|nr:asparaginase [Roseburia sp.]
MIFYFWEGDKGGGLTKKLLLIETGGTIACLPTERGYSPRSVSEIFGGFAGTLSPRDKRLFREGLHGEDPEILPLFSLDSTDLTPAHWRRLYETARDALASRKYSGIVILHGTDTLDYTAALLYYTLKAEIPVILTGAMTPLAEEGSDGVRNLADALLAARDKRLKGVYVAFGGRIIQGNEAIKTRSDAADAFRSFSGADVGRIKDGAVALLREPSQAEIYDYPEKDRNIAVIKLSPLMTGAALVAAVSASGADGAVLEGYGAGGLPEHLLPAARSLAEKIPVVMTSPCIGGARLGEYEVGRRALEVGIADGGTLTTAAAAVRLYLAGVNESVKREF